MNDAEASLVNRILDILTNGLAPATLAAVVIVLLVVSALLGFLYLFRRGVPVAAYDPYASFKAPNISVSVGNNTMKVGSADVGPPVRKLDRQPRPRATRCIMELNRIAELPSDDDEELHVS